MKKLPILFLVLLLSACHELSTPTSSQVSSASSVSCQEQEQSTTLSSVALPEKKTSTRASKSASSTRTTAPKKTRKTEPEPSSSKSREKTSRRKSSSSLETSQPSRRQTRPSSVQETTLPRATRTSQETTSHLTSTPPSSTSLKIDWSIYAGNSGMYWEIATYGPAQAEQAAIAWLNAQISDPSSPYFLQESRYYSTGEWLDGYGIWTVEFYSSNSN